MYYQCEDMRSAFQGECRESAETPRQRKSCFPGNIKKDNMAKYGGRRREVGDMAEEVVGDRSSGALWAMEDWISFLV